MSAPIRITGLPELMAKLDRPAWAERPVRDLHDTWRFFVERGAKGKAPVWRGQLRRSITSERDDARLPRWSRVGTNLPYAPAMEGGTGLLADLPGGTGTRHWPPTAGVAPWARAHGMAPFLVARAIGRRGGLRPRRFLRGAAEEAERRLPRWLGECALAIERAAGAS
jgi:hypothetical protein